MAKSSILLRQALVALAGLSSLPTTTAHSWVEQLQRIAANGTLVSPVGYQRGFVARDNPLFKGDVTDDLWQLPANALGRTKIYDNDTICSPQQSTSNYTAEFPRLVTAAGDYIAMRHEENGHVTLPQNQANKPRNRGTIYIYGTDNSLPNDTLVSIHKVWTVDGTGGDGRGRLLATRNYDDGQCYQVNSGAISSSRQDQFDKVATDPEGADLWCQSDIQLPSDITTGANYTLYWVWDWPTLNKANAMPGEEGVNVTRQEIYTSCMDLEIVDACSDALGDSTACASNSTATTKTSIAQSFDKSQSYGSAAVPQELTGNFAVNVEDAPADSSSNDGMSAPPSLAASAVVASTGTASTFSTVTKSKGSSHHTSSAGGEQDGQTVTVAMSTVTVTAGVTTTTVTATTVTAAANAAATSESSASTDSAASATTSAPGVVAEASNGELGVPRTQGVAPAVTPFMQNRRRRSRISILE
ncbi:hypothetical protein BD289DRAFT_243123 [Coniella lustricola]|uniref:DUF7492 domain-containing protein n=1 Tax=Coniella lustricola TaxID=2025994 RepID=A0A2T3A9F1_9PEZI|nr:hypothetical protein BD289DRAFT_243123 [Coniella lustricola]